MATYDLYSEILDNSLCVDGDIITLGVGDGEDCIAIGNKIKESHLKKKVYANDCFKGLPYTDEESGVYSDLEVGECFVVTGKEFANMVKEAGLSDIVIPKIGLFEDTLPTMKDKKFCFAWVDADLYKSTLVSCRYLQNKMSVGGIIGFHDYISERCIGVKQAIDETLELDKSFELVGGGMGIFAFYKKKEQ